MTVLQGQSAVTSKLTNTSDLNIPQVWERKIQQIIHDNRMLYEPWIESASSFNEIRDRLKGRGYTDLPMGASPLLKMESYSKAPNADTSSCNISRTMIRKKK